MSAKSAYFKTFDDQSDDELPDEMKAVYGNVRLGHVARVAFAAYGDRFAYADSEEGKRIVTTH